MKKKFISVLSAFMVLVILLMSSITVFATTNTVERNFSLLKNQQHSIVFDAEKNTNITIKYDLGCDSASGTMCFRILKQQNGVFYKAVYVKTVDANSSGTLTFKTDERTSYTVYALNNSEKTTSIIGSYKVTYTLPTHSGGGGSF